MTTIAIQMSEEKLHRLTELASQVGKTPKEFLEAIVDAWLTSREMDFSAAAAHVLKKNAALYRRLA